MAVLKREITVFQCDRCGHEWIPRNALDKGDSPLPVVCGKCKSPYWNRPRKTAKPTGRKRASKKRR